MAFKYLNPGYGALTNTSGVTTYFDSAFSPKTGVSFYERYTPTYIILSEQLDKDFYATFDFHLDNYMGDFYAGVIPTETLTSGNTEASVIGIKCNSQKIYACYRGATVGDAILARTYKDKLNYHIWLHAHIDSTFDNCYIEIKVDNNTTILKTGDDLKAAYSTLYSLSNKFVFSFYEYKYYVSNIIISNEYIDPKEQVIQLPIGATETDMSFDEETGLYTASAANQSVLSAVDLTALIDEYGGDSQVTGIALVGNPAYKTAEGLSSLTAFEKDSAGNISEYGNYALTDDTAGAVMNSRILTGKTISDLQGKKFGWIAK